MNNEFEFARPPAGKVLFRKHVQRELDEIRKEVEETCAVAEDVYRVPKSAYKETLSLLEQMPRDISMPDLMWLEDGGIGLEWRPGDGIINPSCYLYPNSCFILVAITNKSTFNSKPAADTA